MDAKCQLEANGLKLIVLGSDAESLGAIDKSKLHTVLTEKFAQKSFAVVWLDYKVLIGGWENGAFQFFANETFEHKYIQRLRVFDHKKELLAWRTNGSLKGRLRQDDFAGTGSMAVIAQQVLFGTLAKPLDVHFTEISETRGTKLILPFAGLCVNDKRDRIFIKTHNYIKPNAIHQVSYFDCRFVAFTDGEKTLS